MTAQNDLKQRLERKATFEAAVKELTQAVKDLSPSSAEATATAAGFELVPRVHTLLKARYSNPSFWKAGLELFKAAQVSTWSIYAMDHAVHACRQPYHSSRGS